MNYFVLFIKKTFRFLLRPLSFLPAVLVMVMIFRFSAQSAQDSSSLSTQITERIVGSINYRLHRNWTPEEQRIRIEQMEHTVRKFAHFSEYLLLAVTLAIPLYVHGVRGIWLILLTELICIVYAFTDEYHQTFVSGRSAQIRDVFIDAGGSFAGILISQPFLYLGRKTVFRPLSLEKERRIKQEYFNRKRNPHALQGQGEDSARGQGTQYHGINTETRRQNRR